MGFKYSSRIEKNCARAAGLSLPVSLKQCVMLCAAIRGKPVAFVKNFLGDVMQKKKPVAFTRFNRDMGHKRGIAAGRFPVNAARHVLGLVSSAESNAQVKGLSSGDLVVLHASAHKGPSTWRFGRKRRRRAKRAHVEIVLQESKKQGRAEKKVKKKESSSDAKKVSVSEKKGPVIKNKSEDKKE